MRGPVPAVSPARPEIAGHSDTDTRAPVPAHHASSAAL